MKASERPSDDLGTWGMAISVKVRSDEYINPYSVNGCEYSKGQFTFDELLYY